MSESEGRRKLTDRLVVAYTPNLHTSLFVLEGRIDAQDQEPMAEWYIVMTQGIAEEMGWRGQ